MIIIIIIIVIIIIIIIIIIVIIIIIIIIIIFLLFCRLLKTISVHLGNHSPFHFIHFAVEIMMQQYG